MTYVKFNESGVKCFNQIIWKLQRYIRLLV